MPQIAGERYDRRTSPWDLLTRLSLPTHAASSLCGGLSTDYTKIIQVGPSIQFIYRMNVCANTMTTCQNEAAPATEVRKSLPRQRARPAGAALHWPSNARGLPRVCQVRQVQHACFLIQLRLGALACFVLACFVQLLTLSFNARSLLCLLFGCCLCCHPGPEDPGWRDVPCARPS